MKTLLSAIKKVIFGIDTKEVLFSTRKFHSGVADVRKHLENIGKQFVFGYHTALFNSEASARDKVLAAIEPEFRGFAFEGAGMSSTLLDFFTPWKRDRFKLLLKNSGQPYRYLVIVGAGWAYARLWQNPLNYIERVDPLLGWLMVDGFGFHEAYFNPKKTIMQQKRAAFCAGNAAAEHVFDQGVGRCLWFYSCADADVVARQIAQFDSSRYADLWAGLGLAVGYAGGVSKQTLTKLSEHIADYQAQFAQGVAFAAKARLSADNIMPHTETASQMFCHCSAQQAALVTDESLTGLNSDNHYMQWQQRIQQHFNRL